MKKSIIYRFIAILFVGLTLMVACTEDIADVRLVPSLSTSEVLDVQSTQATVIGFVIAEGDGFTERGVCYATTPEPNITDNKVAYDTVVLGATFSVTLSDLDYATTYYVKAYATMNSGTIYGDEMSFTTLPETPVVTTAAITDISYTSASGGGEVTDEKGSDVTARGLCWSTSTMPTIADSKTSDGDGPGAFTSSLTGLTENTMYYVRAYATNSAGTGYGDEVSFTTLVPQERTWNLPGNYVAASYPGTSLGDWNPDASPQIKSGASAPDNLEGYVYMAAGANEWKVATTNSWDDTNYGGVAGVLDVGSPNISNGDGYYFITVDANALTYTALATVWGVIGDGTPGGWGADTDLAYEPALQQWTGAMDLTAGGYFKFRSNNDWDPNPNYGAPAGSTDLVQGGDNIEVLESGTYAITLDLSTPLEYTYRADMWGLIGAATPGGWDTDTDMMWDAGNGVFTVTLDLTAGDWKFRANNAWDYDMGGTIGALTVGGGNMTISTAGNYTITLDPWNMVGTITMN